MPPRTRRILVIEDESGQRAELVSTLRLGGYEVVTAQDANQALNFLDGHIDLVLSDLNMGETNGLDLLHTWKQRQPRTPFVLVTAHGDIRSAVRAMKLGAVDYLPKPIDAKELLTLIRGCFARDNTAALRPETSGDEPGLQDIIGQSQPMLEIYALLRRAARAESTILVLGESGTGKEMVAEAIHRLSRRRSGPFVAVNMAAVPPNLVESELFGHQKGAFTGATGTRIGRFEAAAGGTIFIDEIGDFALESQAKLLRVLETRTITPVGSNDERETDARVVAATSRDLDQLVADGSFREDLYYRLTVVTVSLPPLRERRDDIPLLVRRFLDELCQANDRPPLKPDPELMRFLESFDWPGNVRELRNCLESMVVMARGSTLTMTDLPSRVVALRNGGHDAIQIPPGITLESLERRAIEDALARFGANRTHAAQALGISVRTLQRKLKAWHAPDVAKPVSSSQV